MGLAWIGEPLWIEVAINSDSLLLNIFIGNLFDLCLEIRVLRNGREGFSNGSQVLFDRCVQWPLQVKMK